MTRIKEYMELLTSEMEEFRSDVNRLETINDQIRDTKVSIDLSEIKPLLETYNDQLKRQSELQERQYKRLEALFKKAGVYPKWAIITFILAILISVASLVYAYQTKKDCVTLKNETYRKGVINLKITYNPFLKPSLSQKRVLKNDRKGLKYI